MEYESFMCYAHNYLLVRKKERTRTHPTTHTESYLLFMLGHVLYKMLIMYLVCLYIHHACMYVVYIWGAMPKLEMENVCARERERVWGKWHIYFATLFNLRLRLPHLRIKSVFFVSQRGKYVAVFVGGEYHGGILDDGSRGSDGGSGNGGGGGGGGVDMVVALVELAGWLPSFPYKRNKILYVTNPCDILWCNFTFCAIRHSTHTRMQDFQSNNHQQFCLSFFCCFRYSRSFCSPLRPPLGSMFWQTAHTSWYWMIYFVHIAFGCNMFTKAYSSA